jgi:pimeloyl-ACP methyl ester carboxylesterase
VVVAHSRGACDALAFALSEPEFVRDRVEALFLLQGPFGGTALADYVKGHGPSMDGRMPFRFRITAGLIGRIERIVLRRGGHGGLADLTREESRRFWTRMLEVHAYAIPVVSPKTYFLRSECPPSSLGRFLRSIAWYLKTYDGPNDGIVAVRDQYLPDFGTSLGIVECGHGDLARRVSTRGSRHLREAVMRSIVMAVGRG